MVRFAITPEHWQAALQFPTQIALSQTETTAVRLQAARMVQAMLKILLKEAKDKDELRETVEAFVPQQAKQPNVATSEEKDPSAGHPSGHEESCVTLADTAQPKSALATPSQAMPEDVDQTRPRYIGRVGPRKLRGKRR